MRAVGGRYLSVVVFALGTLHVAACSARKSRTACGAVSSGEVARLLQIPRVSSTKLPVTGDDGCRWDGDRERSALFVIEQSDRLLTSDDPADRIQLWAYRDGGVTAERVPGHVTAVVRSKGFVVAADVNGLDEIAGRAAAQRIAKKAIDALDRGWVPRHAPSQPIR